MAGHGSIRTFGPTIELNPRTPVPTVLPVYVGQCEDNDKLLLEFAQSTGKVPFESCNQAAPFCKTAGLNSSLGAFCPRSCGLCIPSLSPTGAPFPSQLPTGAPSYPPTVPLVPVTGASPCTVEQLTALATATNQVAALQRLVATPATAPCGACLMRCVDATSSEASLACTMACAGMDTAAAAKTGAPLAGSTCENRSCADWQSINCRGAIGSGCGRCKAARSSMLIVGGWLLWRLTCYAGRAF